MGRLEGKYAIVTGASRGIGRAIALELAREGCTVGVNYQHNQALAEEVAAEIKSMGRECMLLQANVADPTEARAMVRRFLMRMDDSTLWSTTRGSPVTGRSVK